MSFITSTDRFNALLNLPESISCSEYIDAIKTQTRIISPLNITLLRAQSAKFQTDVIENLPAGRVIRAWTFSLSELNILINTVGAANCPYLRFYNGLLPSGEPIMFALPVRADLTPILDSDTVCVSDLPCPPRTGCPSDSIIT